MPDLLGRKTSDWSKKPKVETTRLLRRQIIQRWTRANSPDPNSPTDADTLLDLIRTGQADAYRTIDNTVTYMLREKYARSTTFTTRTILPSLLRFAKIPGWSKGEFDKDDYNDAVTQVKNTVETTVKEPTADHLKQLMVLANPMYKAIISIMISTGCRIKECITLKLSDIDFKQTPARVTFRPENTKSGEERQSLLTQEATTYLQAWLQKRRHNSADSTWIFPGFNPDQHTNSSEAGHIVTTLFERIGLSEKDDTV